MVKNDLINGNKTLSSSFKLLIEKLWPDNYKNIIKSSYNPKEFKDKISLLYKTNIEPKQLFEFLVSTLHKELNRVKSTPMEKVTNIMDKMDKNLMFYNFIQYFKKNHKSIISDLFYGVNVDIIKCFNCYSQTYNFQIYSLFVFNLEEILLYINKKKANYNFNKYINNNEINIYDCFEYERRIV